MQSFVVHSSHATQRQRYKERKKFEDSVKKAPACMWPATSAKLPKIKAPQEEEENYITSKAHKV